MKALTDTHRVRFTIAATLMIRAIEAFVAWPATIIAAVCVGAFVGGQDPAHDVAAAVYEWADTAVRPAPQGSVLIRVCNKGQQSASTDGKLSQKYSCDGFRDEVVASADAVEDVASNLRSVYVWLVVVSVLAAFVIYPGKRFVGLPITGRKERNKLSAVHAVMETSERGIYKRIDENRELLQLLQERAPDFLAKHFWVEGWLESQDRFLTELLTAMPIDPPLRGCKDSYPRPWPGKRDHAAVGAFGEPSAQ